MSKPRIAPDLCRHMDEHAAPRTPEGAQFRALLSVARAAERVSDDKSGAELALEHLCALDRAVERLRKVSARRPT